MRHRTPSIDISLLGSTRSKSASSLLSPSSKSLEGLVLFNDDGGGDEGEVGDFEIHNSSSDSGSGDSGDHEGEDGPGEKPQKARFYRPN